MLVHKSRYKNVNRQLWTDLKGRKTHSAHGKYTNMLYNFKTLIISISVTHPLIGCVLRSLHSNRQLWLCKQVSVCVQVLFHIFHWQPSLFYGLDHVNWVLLWRCRGYDSLSRMCPVKQWLEMRLAPKTPDNTINEQWENMPVESWSFYNQHLQTFQMAITVGNLWISQDPLQHEINNLSICRYGDTWSRHELLSASYFYVLHLFSCALLLFILKE